MLVYNHNPVSGEYINAASARKSPLEEGVYLIPGHATAVAPPDAVAGHARCWNGASWEQVEDHRGETVYAATDGSAMTITELGALPEGYVGTPPAPTISARESVLAQITALEAQQTPRRIREAALTDEGRAWLEALDAQIAALRPQLRA